MRRLAVYPAFAGQDWVAGDNSDKDPKSIVFSEAGNSEPERVTVDVPWDAH